MTSVFCFVLSHTVFAPAPTPPRSQAAAICCLLFCCFTVFCFRFVAQCFFADLLRSAPHILSSSTYDRTREGRSGGGGGRRGRPAGSAGRSSGGSRLGRLARPGCCSRVTSRVVCERNMRARELCDWWLRPGAPFAGDTANASTAPAPAPQVTAPHAQAYARVRGP